MYKIPENILNVLLNYLAKRPYVEVFQLIAELQRLEKETKAEPKAKK